MSPREFLMRMDNLASDASAKVEEARRLETGKHRAEEQRRVSNDILRLQMILMVTALQEAGYGAGIARMDDINKML